MYFKRYLWNKNNTGCWCIDISLCWPTYSRDLSIYIYMSMNTFTSSYSISALKRQTHHRYGTIGLLTSRTSFNVVYLMVTAHYVCNVEWDHDVTWSTFDISGNHIYDADRSMSWYLRALIHFEEIHNSIKRQTLQITLQPVPTEAT